MQGWLKSDKTEKCPYCGKELHYLYMTVMGRNIAEHLEQCDCLGAVRERKKNLNARREEERREAEMRLKAKIDELYRRSKIGRRFIEKSFDNFQATPDNAAALQAARDYAERFELYAEKGLGLMFHFEGYGTGKTHLACAIANHLIREKQVGVIFGNTASLFSDLRELDDIAPMLEELKRVDLLIIDDLGKERPTEWVAEKTYEIINSRYENLKPIIVTTNMTTAEIANHLGKVGGATVSRISEMCRAVMVGGPDMRQKNGWGCRK
ncbi:DNA replication protein DnaC [Caldanaerobius fijiensis DSM 17918]|uniref:DNA replication protein DnaC n=1 Tax=Caldanaerobius fijiensis DSM 17918 TaxID=1121256 RepID=A0A1M5EL27_9THEO|nr:ATP-binding protein [Caldanaerobius fijiensis]SHF79988.1 DNA replication protein DnaC [Caldanaerobius fijiensis DSM 17918]